MLTDNGSVMKTSYEYFKCTLIAKVSGYIVLCKCKPHTAVSAMLRHRVLNGDSAICLCVGYGCEELGFGPSLPAVVCDLSFELLPPHGSGRNLSATL